MLEFGEEITLTPGKMTQENVTLLRGHGFTDRDILSIVLAAAYRNYIVRVADALGVELNATADYAPELIRAFGVDENEALNTLYADRLTRTVTATQTRAKPTSRSAVKPSTQAICWIETVPPEGAKEQFQKAHDKLARLSAPTPLIHLARALALRPDALEGMVDYMALVTLGGSELGRRLEAVIGLTVAATVSSPYMEVHRAQELLNEGANPEEVKKLAAFPEAAPIEPREREIARFCAQLTHSPWTMARSDVEALRTVGFDDGQIITITAGASLENLLCRVADGLGLQPETELFEPATLGLLGLSPGL